VVPPTAIPTVSSHVDELACFEIPMSDRHPMGNRSFYVRMRLRGIMDIEEELLDNYREHCRRLHELKRNKLGSRFGIAMMEGEMLRQGHEIRKVKWVKLKVLCEVVMIQEEIDAWNAEKPDS
jgi:hypothetical protein